MRKFFNYSEIRLSEVPPRGGRHGRQQERVELTLAPPLPVRSNGQRTGPEVESNQTSQPVTLCKVCARRCAPGSTRDTSVGRPMVPATPTLTAREEPIST